ncbi:hypothetical protein KKF84_20945 [Myxococcota bacterium]|nr:hypothetical protein [Myxococcota bacterium]MBU1537793.1 hypothetical protein [Myxococcota bacterium]
MKHSLYFVIVCTWFAVACSFDGSGLNTNNNNTNNTNNVNNTSNTNNTNNVNNTNNTNGVCGDDQVDAPTEACDGDNLNGFLCADLGYDSGVLACSDSCQFDTAGCTVDQCGNGVIDTGEECDGMDFGANLCHKRSEADLWIGGLVCNTDCTIDWHNCQRARWAKVTSQYFTTCALGYVSEVWCWGKNSSGQLGPSAGGVTYTATPMRVADLDNIVDLESGVSSFCALRSDDTVMCWGENIEGVLGVDASIVYSATPLVIAGLTDTVSLSVGYNHACAVDSAGTVHCWGANNYGQLGDGTLVVSATPVLVDLPVPIQFVRSNNSNSCALTTAGEVYCWGGNSIGELGIGSPSPTRSATPLTIDATGVFTDLGAGAGHFCAVKDDGTLWCWGFNNYGQLGDGTVTTSFGPVQAVDVVDAVRFGGGYLHSCYVNSGGATYCWGYNSSGDLGDGTVTNSNVPVEVLGGHTAVALTSSKWHHNCMLDVEGDIYCWGLNSTGQVGSGYFALAVSSPVPILPTREIALCSDGLDNDMDGIADCDDPDCDNLGACTSEDTVSRCSDNLDNDGDGFIDCLDPQCAGLTVCGPENTTLRCSDGIDNDLSGAVDCDDPQCLPFCNSLYEVFQGQVPTELFDISMGFISITPDGMGRYGFSHGTSAGYTEVVGAGAPSQSLNLDSEDYQEIILPFSFPFFGVTRTSLFLSSKGFITFDESDVDGSSSEQEFLLGAPRIAWYWKDWSPSQSTATDDAIVDFHNDRLVITLESVPDTQGMSNLNVQVVLHNTGQITMYYMDCGTGAGIVGITPGRTEAKNETNFIP